MATFLTVDLEKCVYGIHYQIGFNRFRSRPQFSEKKFDCLNFYISFNLNLTSNYEMYEIC